MKHVMYSTPEMNFIHTHGKSCPAGKSASTRLWCPEVGMYVIRDGRDYAAFILKRLRMLMDDSSMPIQTLLSLIFF